MTCEGSVHPGYPPASGTILRNKTSLKPESTSGLMNSEEIGDVDEQLSFLQKL
jgi:hypothetical protein